MQRHTVDDIHKLVHVARQNRVAAVQKGLVDHWGRRIEPQAPKDDKKKEPHTHDAYCLKCRATQKVETQKVEHVKERKVHHAVGKCQTCGTETHKFMTVADGTKMLGDMATTGGTA